MNTRERKLTSILLLCVGVLLIAFFALIIFPQYQEMSEKADVATEAKNAADAKLAKAEALKKDEKEIKTRLTNLKAKIPSSIEIPNLLIRLDERAAANNLTWLQGDSQDTSTLAASSETAAAQPNTLAPQLTRYDFTMLLQGSLTDLTKFMAELTDKSIGRIIVINNVDIQFKTEGTIEATLKLQIIGWDKGADIGREGCTEQSNTDNSSEDPNCNRTTVEKPTKEGSN